MAQKKIPIEVRAILLFEKAWAVNTVWTFQNAICSLVEVTEPIPEIFVYAQLTGGVGAYDLRIQLRAFDSDFSLGVSDSHRVHFPEDRTTPMELVFHMTSVRFPRSELYEFQLIANHKEVTNGAYCLSVELGGTAS